MRLYFYQYQAVILKNYVLIAFFILSAWSLIATARLNRFYQDSWILEDIEIYILGLILLYIFSTSRQTDLKKVSILTCWLSFLLFALPALKYTYPYLSTSDVSVHISLSKSLHSSGRLITNEGYGSTPGFHMLLAVLSILTGIEVENTAKILPGLLGSFVPLAFYMLCKRSCLSTGVSKWIILLSGLCLPLLYTLNGTSFTIPVFIFLTVFVILSVSEENDTRIRYILLALLFMTQIIFWHPSTCLVMSVFFLSAGIMGYILRNPRIQSFLTWGVLSLVCTLSYWMHTANYVWEKFLLNLQRFLTEDPTPNLIPVRFFQISLADKAIITWMYHARDALFLITAIFGFVMFYRVRRIYRKNLSIESYAVFFLASIALLGGIFIFDFGAQGYKRFLLYCVALAPVLAGYFIWRGIALIKMFIPIKEWILFSLVIFLIFSISFFQIYPYQNLVPVFTSSLDDHASPITWIHQVNSAYQYQMFEYLNKNMGNGKYLLSDYVGVRQEGLFFGSDQTDRRVNTWFVIKPQPALIALHRPGRGGAYSEQVEYRSTGQIDRWRSYPDMSTIYDNGESFILFFPVNAQVISLSTHYQSK